MTFIETLKIVDGHFCNLSLHLERMEKTGRTFFGTSPDVQPEDLNIPEGLRTGVVKCRIIYNSEIQSMDYSSYQPRSIRTLRLVEDDRIDYPFKSTDRNPLNRLFEKREIADDIIIVKQGRITDTSFSNLVFEDRNGYLHTPSSYLLNGTKRQLLLEQHRVSACDISKDDIVKYKRVFLVNAMLDLEDNVSLPTESIIG